MGCTEITEHKGRNVSCRNVGSPLFLLIMMMDDSTTFQEEQIQNKNMGRSENELCLTCLPRGQSTLMRKCVAEQILGNWLETILTKLEISCLDVEAIMEVELTESKHFGNVLFEVSEEQQVIELNDYRTLMMTFGTIGKTMTSNEETVFWKSLVVLCEHVEKNLMVNKLDYGQKNIAVEKEHSKQLANVTMNQTFSDTQRRLTKNSKAHILLLNEVNLVT